MKAEEHYGDCTRIVTGTSVTLKGNEKRLIRINASANIDLRLGLIEEYKAGSEVHVIYNASATATVAVKTASDEALGTLPAAGGMMLLALPVAGVDNWIVRAATASLGVGRSQPHLEAGLFLGGDTAESQNLEWNPVKDLWTVRNAMPNQHKRAGGFYIGDTTNKAYCDGSWTVAGGQMTEVSAAPETYVSRTPSPTSTYAQGGASLPPVGDFPKGFGFGGLDNSSQLVLGTDRYNADTFTWDARQTPPVGRAWQAGASTGFVYGVGGSSNSGFGGAVRDLYRFDDITDNWITRRYVPFPGRIKATAFGITGGLLCFLGREGTTGAGIRPVDEYTELSNSWRQRGTHFPGVAVWDVGGLVLEGVYYFAGGEDGSPRTEAWSYHEAFNVWRAEPALPASNAGWRHTCHTMGR